MLLFSSYSCVVLLQAPAGLCCTDIQRSEVIGETLSPTRCPLLWQLAGAQTIIFTCWQFRRRLHWCWYFHNRSFVCLRPHRAETLSDAFVWHLSVAYIRPKSRIERPRKTKIGTEIAHVTRDSDTTFKVKGQGSTYCWCL